MLFNSFKFILLFLPAFFLSYYLISDRFKNHIILIYSLIFYFFSCFDNIEHLFLLVFSIIINYILARVIYKTKNPIRLLMFVFTLCINLLFLIYFKYFNFIISIINDIIKNVDSTLTLTDEIKKIVLPLGISFYTMQIISYQVDVYKNDIESEKSFVDFATYVLMFSQLVAGPILRYKDVKSELKNKKLDYKNIFKGASLFVFGLSSKVICANLLSYIQIDVNNNILDFSTALAWLSAGAFMLQLYFDFNGYSMMAKGLCKMMGIDILDNFKDPLMSKSVTEFWRKWHISLSIFLRDYIYIPLGGSKKGNIRTLINLFIVFLVSGIWHGANYSFIIFGLLFAFFMIIERLFLYRILDKTIVFGHIYLLMVVFTIFVFFAHEDLSECALYMKNMFLLGDKIYTSAAFDVIKINYKAIIIGIVFITNVPHILYKYIRKSLVINAIVIVLLFLLDLYVINLGYNDPFMYFRF